MIDVPMKADLEISLNHYFGKNIEELIDDYTCPGCNNLGKGVRWSKIVHHPEYLFITVKRYRNDGTKIEGNFSFPTLMNMKEYSS